jgi:hypothetical protein
MVLSLEISTLYLRANIIKYINVTNVARKIREKNINFEQIHMGGKRKSNIIICVKLFDKLFSNLK